MTDEEFDRYEREYEIVEEKHEETEPRVTYIKTGRKFTRYKLIKKKR